MNSALIAYMKELLGLTTLDFKRYLYTQIDWDLRMLAIVGPRGVGKSTMILQRILESKDFDHALYISVDHSYFTQHTLIELADEFVMSGGTHLYIDEVHKYPQWSREIKQIYDTHPELHIVFSGSSVLDIMKGEADLSRRVVLYSMQGLSFREYLELFCHIQTPVVSIKQIFSGKVAVADTKHPLPLFKDYLHHGYYPFAKEGAYYTRLEQVIMQTVEYDIPAFASMSPSTSRKLRKLLKLISQSAPYKPEYTSLANELHVSRNDIPDYLYYLERAGMIGQLRDETGGMRSLGKIEKVYLDNPNLIYALVGDQAEIGTVRETFFYNQCRLHLDVIASKASDFCIGKYTFEVGGKNKKKKQIEGLENTFVVKDDIEYASNNILPLWNFGLLY